MECHKCKQIKNPTKEIKYPCFPCDSCRNFYCMECSELSPSEIKCIPLQKRLLRFYCFACRDFELLALLKNTIADKDTIIEGKNEIIKLLQERLDQCGSRDESVKPSYANVLSEHCKQLTERKQNCPNILIKPKAVQDAKHTKTEISRSVNPVALKVGIRNMQTSRNGMVVVKCSSKHDSELLMGAMRDNLGESYSVEMSKMRKPRVKIVGFNQQMSGDEITSCLKDQNQIFGDIEVVHIRKNRSGFSTVFCECSAEAFGRLVNLKKAYIGWERYPVYEDLNVTRCFRCQGYFHRKDVCRNDVNCGRCGGEHDTRQCSGETKCCRNCVNANLKYKKSYDTGHEATDLDCPVYKYHLQNLRNKTDYVSLSQ